MTQTPTDVQIETTRRKGTFSALSFVWIIPILALLVVFYVAWTAYADRGPLIQIEFENGAGIAAGETELKYRDITVGVVEKVGFTEGLQRVVAHVRLDKDVAPFVDETAVFWVVRPEVSAQGVTGLSTVLSGVYIEGSWDSDVGMGRSLFRGASETPLIRPGQSGLQIVFRTGANGQLTDNAPILYRGIEVGRVGNAKIPPNGSFAIVEALIFEEHRSLINTSTRFWDASGFSVSIGPAGAEIDFSSLAALVGGGITFETFVSGGAPVQDGHIFEVFPYEELARNSLFNASAVETLELSVIFDDNVSGLAVGAPVELSGLKIGEVTTLSGIVDMDQFGDNRVRLNVVISVQPARLGLQGEVNAEAALVFLREQVAAGLRARLASASLLTGGLKVELVQVDDATTEQLVTSAQGLPVMPTTQSEISDTAATVEGVFNRINELPIEELLESAIGFLNAAETLVANEDLQETPQDVRDLLADLRALVGSEDIQRVPGLLTTSLSRIDGIVARLETEGAVDKLLDAIDAAKEAASGVDTAIAGVPELLESLNTLTAKANALPLEKTVAELNSVIEAAQALIADEDLQAAPADLRRVLGSVDSLLTAPEVQAVPGQLNATLGSLEKLMQQLEQDQAVDRLLAAVDSASQAASAVTTSVDGVPQLIEDLQAVAAKANSLEIQELVADLSGLVQSADDLIAADETKALPGELNRALAEVNATLQELREGGAITNVNATLASARNAADSFADATQTLPDVIARMNRLITQVGQTIAGYDRGETLGRAAQATLRDISKAADALASLARTIERNPNSLLLGR